MTINYNVTGAERKRLVQALGEILRWEPVYTKAPDFAYVIDRFTVDKVGALIVPDDVDQEKISMIVEKLGEQGFTPTETPDAVLKDIQEWLGHSDISTTSNIYTHLDFSSKVASAEAIMGFSRQNNTRKKSNRPHRPRRSERT